LWAQFFRRYNYDRPPSIGYPMCATQRRHDEHARKCVNLVKFSHKREKRPLLKILYSDMFSDGRIFIATEFRSSSVVAPYGREGRASTRGFYLKPTRGKRLCSCAPGIGVYAVSQVNRISKNRERSVLIGSIRLPDPCFRVHPARKWGLSHIDGNVLRHRFQ
jgi:hypothetical protein